MSGINPSVCQTRSWSNVKEFHRWLDKIKPLEPSIVSQKVGFDTYLLAPQRTAKTPHCLSVLGGDFSHNNILIDRTIYKVPGQWSCDGLTATQIVEGKIKREVMRSVWLVLCSVEDTSRRWFEVAALLNDLSYPFGEHYLGVRTHAFEDYPSAKKQFKRMISWARKEGA